MNTSEQYGVEMSTELEGLSDEKFALHCTNSANLKLSHILQPNADNVWMQSFCYVAKDNALVVCYIDLRLGRNCAVMQKIRLSDYSVMKQVDNLPYFHCNDITYNPKTNKLYLTPMDVAAPSNVIYVLNVDTFQKEQEISIGTNQYESVYGIAYDSIKDQYYVEMSDVKVLDSAFRIIRTFPYSYEINLGTAQNIEFYDNKVFVVYDNKIVVYNSEGKYIKHFTTLGKMETEGLAYIGEGNFFIGKVISTWDEVQAVPLLYKFNLFDYQEENACTVYKDLEEIGLPLDASMTLEKICDCMQNNSMIQFDGNLPACTALLSELPNAYGNVFIRKIHFARVYLEFNYYDTAEEIDKFYTCAYRSDRPVIQWHELVSSPSSEGRVQAMNGTDVFFYRLRKMGKLVECDICVKGIPEGELGINKKTQKFVGPLTVARIQEGYRPSCYKRLIGACSGTNFARFEMSSNGDVILDCTSIDRMDKDSWFELVTTYIAEQI